MNSDLARPGVERLDPLRYDGHTDDPHEAAGMLHQALPSNAKVLDVGCGTGSLTLVANNGKRNDVIGLEPDSDRAAAARERGLKVVNAELTEEFLREHGPFDAIIFADVIEHLEKPEDVLDLAISGLAPGGQLLASVPNVAHWSVRANLFIGRWNYESVGIMDSTHLRWFTAKTVRSLIEQRGLEILSLGHTAGVDLPCYHRTVFRRIPRNLLKPCIRFLARLWPTLFGCQHIIVARKPEA
jgi:methionine biosynthesis protein MetW